MASNTSEVRRSELAARRIMEAMVPHTLRPHVYNMMADAVLRAHTAHPERWGVRVDPQNVMMKVGMIEVLQIMPHGVHVVIWSPTDGRRVASRGSRYSRTAGTYASVKGSTWRDFDWDELPHRYEKVRSRHLTLVAEAAKTRRHPSTRATHSPGFIQFLSAVVGRELPQPRHLDAAESATARIPEEVLADEEYSEGEVTQVLVRRAERDPAARKACLRKYGYACVGCDRSMADRYGPRGKAIIHVHHLVPLGEGSGTRSTVPTRDLRPVCPNCHAIIHAARPQLTIEALRVLVAKHGA